MILVKSSTITEAGASTLQFISGSPKVFNNVLPPDLCNQDSLVFISNERQLVLALKNLASGFIILQKIYSLTKNQIPTDSNVWVTSNIPLAMSQILPLFDQKQNHRPSGIHPTAIIHHKAKISATANIGAYSVIEEGAEIGDFALIEHHVVVQAFAKVGKQSNLQPFVFLGAFCQVGDSCILYPHSTVGADGFGHATERTKEGLIRHHKIPQIGKVIIEDDCEIGSHTAIDRSTLAVTRVSKGSKIDNLCHIAHNCSLGENAMIAAGFMMAGSTHVGKNFLAAGQVSLNGHIEIADNVILATKSGVISSIEKPGIYGGFPIESQKDNLRTLASLPQLKVLRKQVQKIMKHLNLNNEGDQKNES